jgi:hypothetical protein
VLPTEASLPDKLNTFYACFEADNTEPPRRALAAPDNQVLSLSEADVRKTLIKVNTHKAAGPHVILGRVLRVFADQPEGVFFDIFNLFLSQAVFSTCFKEITIIPVPK